MGLSDSFFLFFDDLAGFALVVEDEDLTRELLSRSLTHDGWTVREARTGAEGLRLVSEDPPDVILLDLIMPEMDGFQFVDELQRDDTWRKIPIVVVTAKDLTAADRMRLNGNVIQILEKGGRDQEQLLRGVREVVMQHSSA